MSRLIQMQARFQQKQMQEKEEKLLKLYESQQQKAFEKVNRSSAGSNGSITTTIQAGKVRQMFDERRQKAGIDKSYPLEPLKTTTSAGNNNSSRSGRTNGITKSIQQDYNNKNGKNTRSIIKTTTTQKSFQQIKNGKPIVGKRQVVQSIYNNNGDESYEERRYVDDNNGNNNNNNNTYYDDDDDDDDNNTRENNLISLMNDHNINDNDDGDYDQRYDNRALESEEMPNLVYDEPDEITNSNSVARKKSPGQNSIAKTKPETKTIVKNNVRKPTTIVRKETKPTIKKSIIKTNTGSVNARNTPSPVVTSRSNQNNRSSSNEMSVRDRAPTTSRPSGKQTSRGPSSAVVRDDLVECRFCNRRFANDRLAVHQEICGKTAKKRRKAYDATKHRVQGTEMEQFVRKGTRGQAKHNIQSTTITKQQNTEQAKSQSKNNWRTQHNEFINTIRAAKMAQVHIAKGGKLSDLPPPPPSSNPDYIQCPHCGRRFNEAAAERHIPKCATYDFNKPKSTSVRGTRSSNK